MKRKYMPFTLTELLVVIGIIIFLTGIIIGVTDLAMNKMAEAKCKSTIERLKTAMESYRAKTGYYIQCSQGGYFYVDTFTPGTVSFRDFFTIQDNELQDNAYLKDSFGYCFIYQCPGYVNRMAFDFYSAGTDGFSYVNWRGSSSWTLSKRAQYILDDIW